MPSIRYGISPWLDAVPVKKRREYPAFRGVITHPVVIIGGGMSGAMTAYACASAGYKVILLEADRIGLGGTGRATGLLSGEACDSYRELEARAGRRAARAMFDAMQSAPRELAATIKRLGISAGFEPADQLRVLPPGESDKLHSARAQRAPGRRREGVVDGARRDHRGWPRSTPAARCGCPMPASSIPSS